MESSIWIKQKISSITAIWTALSTDDVASKKLQQLEAGNKVIIDSEPQLEGPLWFWCRADLLSTISLNTRPCLEY